MHSSEINRQYTTQGTGQDAAYRGLGAGVAPAVRRRVVDAFDIDTKRSKLSVQSFDM